MAERLTYEYSWFECNDAKWLYLKNTFEITN